MRAHLLLIWALSFFLAEGENALADGCISAPTTNFGTKQVTINASATLIVASRCRFGITLYNSGSATIYIGPSSAVTTSTGMPLTQGSALTLNTNSALYGIVSTSTQTIAETETF